MIILLGASIRQLTRGIIEEEYGRDGSRTIGSRTLANSLTCNIWFQYFQGGIWSGRQ